MDVFLLLSAGDVGGLLGFVTEFKALLRLLLDDILLSSTNQLMSAKVLSDPNSQDQCADPHQEVGKDLFISLSRESLLLN